MITNKVLLRGVLGGTILLLATGIVLLNDADLHTINADINSDSPFTFSDSPFPGSGLTHIQLAGSEGHTPDTDDALTHQEDVTTSPRSGSIPNKPGK